MARLTRSAQKMIPLPATLIAYAIAATLAIGGLWWGKSNYDESKRAQGRAEVWAEWNAANESARLKARAFEATQTKSNAALDASYAKVKAANATITKAQYDERDTLLQILRSREQLANAAIDECRLRDPAASSPLPNPSTAPACIDVAARATSAAIDLHRTAINNADQVAALQHYITQLLAAQPDPPTQPTPSPQSP
jgi:hypothetical protein